MYIFISHSSKDAATAQELCTLLEANHSACFLSSRDIRPGQEYASELIDALDRSDMVLLLLSGHAVASPHVLREIERAVSKSVPILVYKLEDVTLPKSFEYFLMPHQWLDAECCRYDALLTCIREIKNEVPVASPVTVPPKKPGKKLFAILLLLAVLLVLGVSLGTAFSRPSKSEVLLQPGDSVILGTYHDTPIEWKVLSVSEDNTEALLVAKHILTFKAFDGADSGKVSFFETSTDALGSNCWSDSAIRTWLNSDSDYVSYQGAAPTDLSMSDGCNGYDLEAGFLYGFTPEELQAIQETLLETNGSSTIDKVFLLSQNDLSLFEAAGVSLFAVPTAEAIAHNESCYYTEYCLGVFKTEASAWWLRDSIEGSDTKVLLVSHGAKGQITEDSTVCADGYGIRPAIIVNLSSGLITDTD